MQRKTIDLAGGIFIEAKSLADATGSLITQANPLATSNNAHGGAVGGTTMAHYTSAASLNPTVVKAAPGRLFGVSITNTVATARYLKIYDKSTAPTVGTDAVVKTIKIPSSGQGNWTGTIGAAFLNGIAFGTTTGAADSDATAVAAGDLIIDFDYS